MRHARDALRHPSAEGGSRMPGHWQYWNPVQITFGGGTLNQISRKIAGRPYCLVTYPDEIFTPVVERIVASAGEPACLIRNVAPNPDYASLETACSAFGRSRSKPRVIVALGGGSAIDTAKVLAAGGDDFSRVRLRRPHREDRGSINRAKDLFGSRLTR